MKFALVGFFIDSTTGLGKTGLADVVFNGYRCDETGATVETYTNLASTEKGVGLYNLVFDEDLAGGWVEGVFSTASTAVKEKVSPAFNQDWAKVWATQLARLDEAVSAAKTLTAAYDAAKTAASQASVTDIKAKTDNLPSDPADQSQVEAAITAAVGTTVGAVWDEVLTGATHNVSASAGKRLRQLTVNNVHDGTLQVGGNGYNIVKLAADAPSTAIDPAIIVFYKNADVQVGQCVQYDGSTKLAALRRNLKTQVDNTWDYIVYGGEGGLATNDGLCQGGGLTYAYLNTLANTEPDAYKDQVIFFTANGQIEDSSRIITSSLVEAGKVRVNFSALPAAPTTETSYEILPLGNVAVDARVAITQLDANLLASGTLSIRTHTTYQTSLSSTITDDLSSATEIWLAVKTDADDEDSESIIFLSQSTGLEVLNGAAYGTPAHGTLSVTGSSGAWSIDPVFSHTALALLTARQKLVMEVKALLASGKTVVACAGPAAIVTGIVKATS